ncbi:MAG: hypothetical protein GC184_09540 [Rhizobiales bacterium]|nr:hypothetical protein [Hyphomicrobiales bacterium]
MTVPVNRIGLALPDGIFHMTLRRFPVFQLCLCLALLLVPAGLYADTAGDSFARGDFLNAAKEARLLGTARGDALAARATLIDIEFLAPVSSRASLLPIALADARRAVARDDTDPEAHLYLAIALGFKARMEGRMAAHFEGLGHEAYQHIQRALELAPGDGWAHAVLGGWNLEICIRGGLLGRSIYRASVSNGIDAFEKAIALDPNNPSIIFQYAVQLMALDAESGTARARSLLASLHDVLPADAFERLGMARAHLLEGLIEKGDREALNSFISRQMALENDPISLPNP